MSNAAEIDRDDLILQRRLLRSVVYIRAGTKAIAQVMRALDLPGEHQSRAGDPVAYWNGQGQWLLTSDRLAVDDIRASLNPRMPDALVGFADLSSAFVCLEVRGAAAPAVLSSGCCLDFHPKCHPIGQTARTGFARVPALIVRTNEDAFEMYVDCSYSDYLSDWFRTASADPGIGMISQIPYPHPEEKLADECADNPDAEGSST